MSARSPYIAQVRTDWELTEPIEIRMVDGNGNRYQYLGSVRHPGTLWHSLECDGQSNAMSNGQPRGTVYPRKAVAGWQQEMVRYFDEGYYTIESIR